MQILLIKIAVIVVFWSGGMFALNKIFGMILKRKEQIHIKFLRSMSKVAADNHSLYLASADFLIPLRR